MEIIITTTQNYQPNLRRRYALPFIQSYFCIETDFTISREDNNFGIHAFSGNSLSAVNPQLTLK